MGSCCILAILSGCLPVTVCPGRPTALFTFGLAVTSRAPLSPQLLQRASGYSEPYLLLEILMLWAMGLSGGPAFCRPRLATGLPPCETHMSTALRKAGPLVYLVTPDLEFHPSIPAFAQLLLIESVGGWVSRDMEPRAFREAWEAVGDDLASC